MATIYAQRNLFGGAITVDLPNEFIDASDLRQIPDHQEVFLSPTSLTSIIFEINSYQSPDDILQHGASTTTQIAALSSSIKPPTNTETTNDRDDTTATSTTTTTISKETIEASIFHLLDSIDPPDTLDQNSLNISSFPTSPSTSTSTSTTIPKLKSSLSPFPTSLTSATILTPPSSSSRPSAQTKTTTTQLLIRLQSYDTDLCVRVNVPLAESRGLPEAENREIDLGREIVGRILRSLDVREFGLFGG